MPAVPLPPRPPEAACAHPEVHAASQEQSLELIVTSKRPRNRAELVTFPADLDSGDAARHVFLDHFLRGDPEQRLLFEGAAFKLCALDRCSGTGTSVASHVARAPPSPVRTTAPSRAETKFNLQAPLGAPSPPNAKPAPPTVDGEPQVGTPIPEVGFILMEENQSFAKEQPRSAHDCTRWDEPCASTVRLPEGTRLGEFSFSLNLRFEAIDPPTLSRPVEPYADDCWWRDEQPLLADASGACGDAPRFAVLVTVDGGLRWIVEDGADAGPGRAWSVEAPAPHEGGVLDSRWHNVTLVRRFGDDGDAALELWLDGELQGIEASSARTDLAPRWLDDEDHLRAPWSWSLAGDMGLMQLWERALDAHELEALRPASLLDLMP
ncbi:hypothetical protein [Nannocystis bainbridge]|uniref:LamG domain-containing protein n=1 Tax=Nannocystis bainbridge TaxID=2995303 RepID=A0ABT5ED82_9BACT|nr:hypothetical protein [Nannocystis bainbridge]MDC0722868.1 hypothetical protein [Nannocystis bainbridge]